MEQYLSLILAVITDKKVLTPFLDYSNKNLKLQLFLIKEEIDKIMGLDVLL